jgi:hypothetical protein
MANVFRYLTVFSLFHRWLRNGELRAAGYARNDQIDIAIETRGPGHNAGARTRSFCPSLHRMPHPAPDVEILTGRLAENRQRHVAPREFKAGRPQRCRCLHSGGPSSRTLIFSNAGLQPGALATAQKAKPFKRFRTATPWQNHRAEARY